MKTEHHAFQKFEGADTKVIRIGDLFAIAIKGKLVVWAVSGVSVLRTGANSDVHHKTKEHKMRSKVE